jgi:GNAT superfamily N-acetyltransferase
MSRACYEPCTKKNTGQGKERVQVTVTIRIGEARDVAALTQFNIAMALETEYRRLDPETVTAGVLSLIGAPSGGFYVVAEEGGTAVAALMVTYEWSDWRNKCFWWIQSVYVVPSHRRQGIFTRLFEHVKSMAQRRDDVCGLRLYVEQHNAIAQATYKSLGMDETHYDMYEVEFHS